MTLNTMLENYKKFEEIKNAFIFMLKSESTKEIYNTITNLKSYSMTIGKDTEQIRVFITSDFKIDIDKFYVEEGIYKGTHIYITVDYKNYSYHETIKDNIDNISKVFDLFNIYKEV